MKTKQLIKSIVLAVVVIGLSVSQTKAAVLYENNYGDVPGTTVTYFDVTEASDTDAHALYGAPTPSGNALLFEPTGFSALSENGITDFTDGTLHFTVHADSGFVSELRFSESGDFNLSGWSGDALAQVSALFNVLITEVDGVVLPGGPILAQSVMTFNPETDGQFFLSDNAPNVSYVGNWNGSMNLNLEDVLIASNVVFSAGVTEAYVSLDNQLLAMSQNGTRSFIKKKTFNGFTVTAIPEPNSMILIGLASTTIVFVRSRFLV